MKQLITLSLIFVATASVAQKVDLDRFYFKTSFQRLPKENVPIEKRTYGVKVNVGGAIRGYKDEGLLYDKIYLYGWKKVEADPTVGIEANLDDFTFRGAESKNETVENKDKDGKVTSRNTYYWVQSNYEGRGICRVKGPMTPKPLSAKELEEQKKKEETKVTNRFLANANIAKPTEETNGLNFGLGSSYNFTTEKTSSSTAANNDFNNKKDAVYQDNLRKFVDGSINYINNRMNDTYGFAPVNNDDFLWILNSKDHPEYQTQQDAIQAVKELFKTMKADESVANLESNLNPLIDYLQSLKTKYSGDDKRNKKMRYSAYFNLSKIYYYLDKPEKAREEAEGLIKNDFDEKDGEDLAKMANNLIELFNTTKFNTRHNESYK